MPDRAETAIDDVSRAATPHPIKSELETTAKRLAERDLVGVLEVGTDREAAGQPRNRDAGGAFAEQVGDVERGRLARCGRVRGNHDLANAVRGHPSDQFVDVEVV